MNSINRRSFLAATALIAAAPTSLLTTSRQDKGATSPTLVIPAARRRVMRVAHLTDIHVQPERGADAGIAQCLAHAQSLNPKPDLILTGGDGVMDVFASKQARASELKALFTTTFKNHCDIAARHTIGNHDIFGWNKNASDTTGSEADWGKKFAAELYGIPNRFYSFDMNGWHFVVLDSVQPMDAGYVAFCDDEQNEWLIKDLKSRPVGSPVLVVSHIPVLSLTSITYGKPRSIEKRGQDTVILAASMHTDGDALHQLFRSNGVKLCLSGHQHLLDRCTTNGITYICDGAVSGNWWKGIHDGVPEGYGVIDLFDDGSFEHQYMTYGWNARASAGDHTDDFIRA